MSLTDHITASRVVDPGAFEIADGPRVPLEELVLYELHVGTFSPGGTFAAAIPKLAAEMGPDDFRPLDDWGHDAMWLDNLTTSCTCC